MSSQFNETEDDLPLHTRGTVRDTYGRSEGHAVEMSDTPAPEREVTLNTGVVLGLFFALALLCAVFFGFGYSIGHKSAPVAVASAEPEVVTTTESTGASSATPKPSPNVPQAVPEYVPSAGAERSATTVVKPLPAVAPSPKPVVIAPTTSGAAVPPPARVVRVPAPAAEAPAAAPAATPAGPGSTYVQVAAVSHQEDADVLLSALRRRGYAVQTRSEPADHLIHVQLGPFGTRKEADAMRLRLAGDGYNAFIK